MHMFAKFFIKMLFFLWNVFHFFGDMDIFCSFPGGHDLKGVESLGEFFPAWNARVYEMIFLSLDEEKNLQIANKNSNSKFWNDFSSTNTNITVRLCFRLNETTFPDGVTILQRKKRGDNQLQVIPSVNRAIFNSLQVADNKKWRQSIEDLSTKLKTWSCFGRDQVFFFWIWPGTKKMRSITKAWNLTVIW